MTYRNFLFPPNAQRFKGGGGGTAPAMIAPPVAAPPPTPVTAPATPAPTIQAPPAPTATQDGPNVVQARIDARRAQAKKRGINSTILQGAGDEGGAQLLGGGKTTLLGGG